MKKGKCFLLKTSFFDDERVNALREEFGLVAQSTILRLLCRIYKNGKSIEYTGSLVQSMASEVDVPCATINAIVERAVDYGLFNRSKFENNLLVPSAEISKVG